MEKKQKLLVIDDSKETVAGLNSFLSQKYDVITAFNGLDGKGGKEHEGKMHFMRERTQPGSRDFRGLFRAGQMLFMQRYDGGEVYRR